MSSATAAAAATPPTQRPSAVPQPTTAQRAPVPTGSGQQAPAPRRRGTPQVLRLWTLGTAAVCVLLTLVSVIVLSNGATALSQASADTQQLIRMQSIRANLLRADALATNAFLVGGLEPAEQRAAYDEALRQSVQSITDAAAAQPADREALAALSHAVLAYSATMEQARANNRQGFPVGAAYLAAASTELRETAIPIVDALASENRLRADRQLGSLDNGFYEVTSVLALVVLVICLIWTARRFRRVINPGLAISVALVLTTMIVGSAVLSATRSTVDDVRDDEVAVISAAGTARSAANEAKVQESLRLIARGSGAGAEQEWETQSGYVEEQLEGTLSAHDDLRRLWSQYTAEHQRIVTLDDSGRYDDAVEQATLSGPDASNARFQAFDEATAQVAADASARVVDRLGGLSTQLWVLMVGSAAAALAAAVTAIWGLRLRLREYL